MTTSSAAITSAALAEHYWQADLDHHHACQQMWATGLDLPNEDPIVARALDLNDLLIELAEEFDRRADTLTAVDLADLAVFTDVDPDAITAAAVLRVITSDVYTADAEALQPGAELPAVGVWADPGD